MLNVPNVGSKLSNGAEVIAIHSHGNALAGLTVVLAYVEHKRVYVVWTLDPDGDAHHGTERFDVNDAMNEYSKRVMSLMYAWQNRIAPTITYDRRNNA